MNVGDRVVVNSTAFSDQNGITGIVTNMLNEPYLTVQIRYDDTPENNSHPYALKYPDLRIGGYTNSYTEACLEIIRAASPCDAGAMEYEEIMEYQK